MSRLAYLDLSGNDLENPSWVNYLFGEPTPGLQDRANLKNLWELDLRSTNFGFRCLSPFGEHIPGMSNLITLRLDDNLINDLGLVRFSERVRQVPEGNSTSVPSPELVKELISRRIGFTRDDIPVDGKMSRRMEQAMSSWLGGLELNNLLGKGPLGTLQTLTLSKNLIGESVNGVMALSRMLVSFPKLKRLDLSGNRLAVSGIKGFNMVKEALSMLQNLEHVDLSDNSLGSLGPTVLNFEIIARGRSAPPTITKLKVLDVHNNRLGNSGVLQLVRFLQSLEDISTIILWGNNLDYGGAKRLVDELVNLSSVRLVHLRGPPGTEGELLTEEQITSLASLVPGIILK